MGDVSKVLVLTNEYPPHVYGGAGVHVEYLTRELARSVSVEVRCFGDQDTEQPNLRVRGYLGWEEIRRGGDRRHWSALDALSRNLLMVRDPIDADVIHAHTWYTDLAALWGRLLWERPYVLTVHSLEPLRPWKAEQLGTAYRLSSWMERTAIEAADAVIAVSGATRQDVLHLFAIPPERVHVIHNGIDIDLYRKTSETSALERAGVDLGRPYVLFVGRITRQKGIVHLLDAVRILRPDVQVVLLAGQPDTPELAQAVETRVAELRARRRGIVWIPEMLPRSDVIQFYSHATVFCCPSIYEPFGLINLEAMACECPVVASDVGGIPEVVVDGETGILVHVEVDPERGEPVDPDTFARDLAAAIQRIVDDPELRERLGRNGRARVEQHFSWRAVAQRTLDLYRRLV
ncbi:glycogen synthase [Thermomicrobium sp. 4228-Ro]|uniref:glycogen synthase n=1 Tax=Thermomicrobium sp. 4228-Ro TaxID=2993937 RepID=UPI0022494ECF|nr:glycogen synthase [Thermomicrobium sp. 4228-Ro]MCX2726913.1 glycogen synthase [Thermomicrobium sp. 4228-Ro]